MIQYACPCCGADGTQDRLKVALAELEALVGEKLSSNSCYRCPAHNKWVGGQKGSFHPKGLAADVDLPKRVHPDEFIRMARKCGFNGIGYGSGYRHIDLRTKFAAWHYVNGKAVPLKDPVPVSPVSLV